MRTFAEIAVACFLLAAATAQNDDSADCRQISSSCSPGQCCAPGNARHATPGYCRVSIFAVVGNTGGSAGYCSCVNDYQDCIPDGLFATQCCNAPNSVCRTVAGSSNPLVAQCVPADPAGSCVPDGNYCTPGRAPCCSKANNSSSTIDCIHDSRGSYNGRYQCISPNQQTQCRADGQSCEWASGASNCCSDIVCFKNKCSVTARLITRK